MNKVLEIQSVMHPFPHSVGVAQKLKTAKEMLAEYNIRHLPVQKGGELIGIISENDILFAQAVEQAKGDELTVADAFTEEPYVVEPTASVASVARRMADDHIGCALIAEKGRLVGIFTTVDACRTLHHCLAGSYQE